MCALHCAQLLRRIGLLHRTDLIIFTLTLQTITISRWSDDVYLREGEKFFCIKDILANSGGHTATVTGGFDYAVSYSSVVALKRSFWTKDMEQTDDQTEERAPASLNAPTFVAGAYGE